MLKSDSSARNMSGIFDARQILRLTSARQGSTHEILSSRVGVAHPPTGPPSQRPAFARPILGGGGRAGGMFNSAGVASPSMKLAGGGLEHQSNGEGATSRHNREVLFLERILTMNAIAATHAR